MAEIHLNLQPSAAIKARRAPNFLSRHFNSIISHGILLTYSALALAPMLLILLNSFKDRKDLFRVPYQPPIWFSFQNGFSLTNISSLKGYQQVFARAEVLTYAGNSLLITSGALFLILMAGGYDLTVIALIGIILLIGIVKKNGIMMVDFAITAERRDGQSPHDAIRQACLMRFRPILMTTMAALLGGFPLVLGDGAGSELRKPLGYTMIGGLIFSQILTLYTTPVVYLYLDRVQRWLAPSRRSRLPKLAEKMGATAD